MKRTIHAMAGISAIVIIALFISATLYAELMGSMTQVSTVKHLIVTPGLFILVPCLMVAGGSGFSLSRSRRGRLVSAKKKRMPVIALNGVFVLIPCALALRYWAMHQYFDWPFVMVQAVELVAGGLNLSLLLLSARDGLRLSGRIPRRDFQASD